VAEPAPWTRIYNRIKTQIPACPDALLRQELFAIMVDFTQDTNVWIEEVPLAIVPNTTSYPFTVTNGTPNRLMRVWRSDDPVRHWADNGVTMRIPGVIELFRALSEPVSWTAAIAKACSNPQMTADVPPKDTGYPAIDSWIVDKYNDAIYFGTMYYLQRAPGKPFSSPKSAGENGAYYSSEKSKARNDFLKANVWGGQAWAFPQGFATISRKGWV